VSFGRKLTLAFTALVVVLVLAAASALATLRLVVGTNEQIVEISDERASVLEARVQAEQLVAVGRGYLLTGNEQARQRLDHLDKQFDSTLRELEGRASARHDRILSQLSRVADTYVKTIRATAQERVAAGDPAVILDAFETRVQPLRQQFEEMANSFVTREREHATNSTIAARSIAHTAQVALVALLSFALVLAFVLAWIVGRKLVSQFQRVERATEMARRAAAARDEILATVSHDLRTPLTAVALGADVLEESGVRPDQERVVRTISNASIRMQHLIEDLLKREQLQSGMIDLTRLTVDREALVSTALELLREKARVKGVELHSEVSSGEVNIDRERLLQVLSNLIGNALKFTPTGGTVTVRAFPTKDATRFSVEDTGAGIPAEQLPHLFDKFFQGEKRETGSVGLGLHICKRIVEAHGGAIGVESSQRGTTFWFTIPNRPFGHDPASVSHP